VLADQDQHRGARDERDRGGVGGQGKAEEEAGADVAGPVLALQREQGADADGEGEDHREPGTQESVGGVRAVEEQHQRGRQCGERPDPALGEGEEQPGGEHNGAAGEQSEREVVDPGQVEDRAVDEPGDEDQVAVVWLDRAA
jgi:hypothetical protein